MHKGHFALLSIIADGNIHSGQALAMQLKVSRAAIWKSIKYIESLGLPIEAVQGQGYHLVSEISLLAKEKIINAVTPIAKECCNEVEVLFKTKSTNSYLLNKLNTEHIHGKVVIAEYQTDGRGRRGNQWVSPLASGVCLSLGWRFDIAPRALGLLSLYMGVAVARTLSSFGLKDIGLKWPNDIHVKDKKVGGILLELRGEASGPVDVIIGIGLNYDLPKFAMSSIEQAVTDICSLTCERFSRNNIAATLLSNVFEILQSVPSDMSNRLIDEWRQYDRYVERNATLSLPGEEIVGVLKGVDDQGSLIMNVDGQMRRFTSGEISLRIQR